MFFQSLLDSGFRRNDVRSAFCKSLNFAKVSRIFRHLRIAFIPALFFCVLCTSDALGDDFTLIPQAALKQQYNDNLFLDTEKKKSDYITTVSPGFEIGNRTERYDLGATARWDGVWYAREHDLNALDHTYTGKGQFRFSPRFSLSGNAAYTRDSQPDRDIETTGLVLSTARRERQVYGVTGDWILTEKTAGALSYGFEQDRFDSANFADYAMHSVNLGIGHDLGHMLPMLKGRANLGYNMIRSTDSKVQNYTGTIGASWSYDEKWSVLVDAGAVYTESEFKASIVQLVPPFFYVVTTEEKTNSGWGAIGRIALSYKDEYTSGNVYFRHDIVPASGRNGASARTSAGIELSHRFTEELTGSIAAGFFMNRSDQGEYAATEINENTVNLNPRVRYNFTKDVSMEGSYTYTRVMYRNEDTYAERNLVMLRFFIQHALLE